MEAKNKTHNNKNQNSNIIIHDPYTIRITVITINVNNLKSDQRNNNNNSNGTRKKNRRKTAA